MKKIDILGCQINASSKTEIIKYIDDYLSSKNRDTPLTISTPNPEIIMQMRDNSYYREIINNSDISIPDGAGIVFAGKILKNIKLQRISGIDLLLDLINLSLKKEYSVMFIGGKDHVAQKALANLRKQYFNLKGWAIDGPEILIQKSKGKSQNLNEIYEIENEEYFQQSIKDIAKQIVDESAKLIFVGLGAPKQELFINDLKKQLLINNYQLPIIMMSVGGSFDIISGRLKRAPKLFQSLNLEWLWRLIQEPWRIFRQLRLIEFIWLVLKEKFKLK